VRGETRHRPAGRRATPPRARVARRGGCSTPPTPTRRCGRERKRLRNNATRTACPRAATTAPTRERPLRPLVSVCVSVCVSVGGCGRVTRNILLYDRISKH
jgi:hypothetical protein